MPVYECPRDGETFTEKPAGGRCPTHKVLVKEVAADAAVAVAVAVPKRPRRRKASSPRRQATGRRASRRG